MSCKKGKGVDILDIIKSNKSKQVNMLEQNHCLQLLMSSANNTYQVVGPGCF